MNVAREDAEEIVSDPDVLLRYGVCKLRIPTDKVSADVWAGWARHLSQVTPEIMAGEGDGEYVFYRNIMEEPDFPFDAILRSSIGDAIVKHFGLGSVDEIRLDDAFCIHYNAADQYDTSGAKHTDPSDLTVNMCLEKSDDAQGSHVRFYGTKPIGKAERDTTTEPLSFLVRQDAGYATIHWGSHLHGTTPLLSGTRTNIVLTFWFTDPKRSDVASRNCYS
jgi:hypothetical protein